MFKALLVLLLYICCLGYLTVEYMWRDRNDRLRFLYLKGWQESAYPELIFAVLITFITILLIVKFAV